LNFRKLTLDDIDVIRPFFNTNYSRVCDHTIGGTIIWRDFYKTEYAIDGGALFLRLYLRDGQGYYAPPLVGDNRHAYDRLVSHCREAGEAKLQICTASCDDISKLADSFPKFECVYNRDWCDYLYLSGDLAGFEGRRYSGQRNHINKFKRTHKNWTFEIIEDKHLPEVRDFFDGILKIENGHTTLDEGNRKTFEIIDNYEKYGFFGGVLKVDGKVIGASFGEILNDTLYVHVEKADREHPGAYQMLVNRFADTFTDINIKYINREEDDGDEGLRRSKLSYHPVELLKKYIVYIDI
jgi:hypothetical protein